MSLEDDLFTALRSLVGNRVGPVIFPQPPAIPEWPAIQYTIVDSVPSIDACGDGGDATATPRVQLDVRARTDQAARALRLSVMTAMASFSPPAVLQLSLDGGYEDKTKTHRQILDYTIHPSTTTFSGSP